MSFSNVIPIRAFSYILGCNDSTAFNYNSEVSFNDGSFNYDVVVGCTDSVACNYNYLANTNDQSCVYSQLGYDCDGNILPYIGMEAYGGVVFYIDETRYHGLVAYPQDHYDDMWGCSATEIGTMTEFGSGYSNTWLMLDLLYSSNYNYYDGYECGYLADYVTNIYDEYINTCHYENPGAPCEWYLPSRDELDLMLENLFRSTYTNDNPNDDNQFQFNGSSYWSSSEGDEYPLLQAYCCHVWGGCDDNNSKLMFKTIRPIRSF